MPSDPAPAHLAAESSDAASAAPGPTVVGIGASAGGLAALQAFFAHVPEDSGLVYVVVVHLSPEHPSHLAELLQPHVAVPVQQVTETTPLETDRVYVIPPDRNLSAIDTHLRLSPLEEERRDRAPIDHFFRTLARVHDGHSVAVVLTGTGSDGALGVQAVKERGGLVVVQDPAEAEHDGMPQSAIATGAADLVLPVAEIAPAILGFEGTRPRMPGDGEDGRLLDQVLAQVHTRTGRDYGRYKRSTIHRRISRRMQLGGVERLGAYLDRLRADPEEVQALADDFLIIVTQFFRDPEVFDRLAAQTVPSLFERKGPEDTVRAWSVGCATGEEAYSLAILLLEEAARREGRGEAAPGVQVFASDLHHASLDRAREGFYPGSVEADVSAERLERFFRREDGGYRVRRAVREAVVFAPHNLLADPPFSRLDLVVCRNVLIYLERAVQREVAELFHYALRPGGALVLGTSETVDSAELFRTESKRLGVYRKRNVPTREPRLPVFPASRGRTPDRLAPPAAPRPIAYGSLHGQLVALSAPPSLLVSPDDDVVHVGEGAGRFLAVPPGEPTRNVFRLVRDALQIELRAALYAARQHGETRRSRPVRVWFDGAEAVVAVEVRPSPDEPGFALVAFVERAAPEPAEAGGEGGRTAELEAELDLSHQRLRTVIEEDESAREALSAANEELQSANEELRSTMEELETSKEELQSMNEELRTVNQENRHKVAELGQLSADLQNLLTSTDIATLFLDRGLRIMRFTPRVADFFNVRPADRGRPLSDLTNRLLVGDEVLDDARHVLDTLVPTEREVEDEAGRWYLARTLPYRSADDRIEGVVVTFVDVTTRKRAELALDVARIGSFVWYPEEDRTEADVQLLALFGLPPDGQVSLASALDSLLHPADRDRYGEAVARALDPAAGGQLRETVRVATSGPERTLLVTGRVEFGGGPPRALRMVGVVADVTEQRQVERVLRARETHQAFLVRLTDALRPLADPANVLDTAARLLGRQLGADQAGYAQDLDGERSDVGRGYVAEGVVPVEGVLRYDAFPDSHVGPLRAGRTVVYDNFAEDPSLSDDERAVYAGLGVRGLVNVPLVKDGRLVAVLFVHSRAARAWTADEVTLVEEAADRTWETVERVRAEDALRTSQGRLRLALEASGIGTHTYEVEADAHHLDARAREIVGGGEGVGFDGWLDLVHADDRGRMTAAAERALDPAGDGVFDETYRIVRDGAVRWVYVRSRTAFAGGGAAGRRPERVVGTVQDVTAAQEAAAALRAGEERLRQAVAAADLGTWTHDPADRSTYFDARAQEIFGFDTATPEPAEIDARIHPDDFASFAAARAAALEPGGPEAFAETHRVVRPDGSERWVRGRARTLFEGEGPARRPARAVGVVVDVTDQHEAEAALRASEERFRRTAETVPDILFTAGPDGTVEYVNGRFEEVTGRPTEEAVGSQMWEGLVHPDDRGAAEAALDEGRGGEGPHEARYRLRTAGGAYRWFLTRLHPARDAGGRVAEWFGTATDIDDIVRAEREVRALNETLERRVQRRTALARRLLARLTVAEEEERKRIAVVLHDDLQQRLYGLSMALTLLRGPVAAAGDPDLLDKAEDVLGDAMALTRTLATELSPAVLDAADLTELFEWTADHVQRQYGLAVEVVVEPRSRIDEHAVRVAVYQAVREALFNVAKHAQTDRARISAWSGPGDEGGVVVVRVEDEGVGFAAPPLSEAGEGTGLGLPGAAGRIDLVGGRLEVDSAPGEGTRLTITVPVRLGGPGNA